MGEIPCQSNSLLILKPSPILKWVWKLLATTGSPSILSFLVESISDLKREVVCVLDQVSPEYQSIFSGIFVKTSKEILLQFSSPIDFEPVFSETLAQLSRQKIGTAKAEQLKAAASCMNFPVLLQTCSLVCRTIPLCMFCFRVWFKYPSGLV